jgi:hypothetical protein
MGRYSNTLKFVHKMSADIIKFVSSSVELVHLLVLLCELFNIFCV